MKQNDWIALNLNIKDSGINVDSLRLYNITPDNTGLEDKDYYKTIPQVQQIFTDNTTGLFDEKAFSEFYDSAKRSYNDFAANDYARELINDIPTSRNDIFSLGNSNIRNDSAYVFSSHDPNRHTMGIGNIFETGAAVFSEREVAQANKVADENGKFLDWSANDKGGLLKGLFRPTLALAEYDKDEYDDNGNLIHHKGERKYNEFGDPYYQILGDKEVYGKDIIRYADTLTKEGTWLNKIDIFDRDGIKTSPGQTVLWTIASIAPFLTPYGYAFGALKAAIDLGQTIPVMAKMINGFITNDDTNDFSKQMTSVENFFSKFGRSESDYARQHRWGLEGIAQMIVDSAGQLYSQRLIQKIPKYLSDIRKVHLTEEGIRHAQMLSSAYMATTSAKEVYGEYRQAGLNPRMAGAGAFATMMAYYIFMQNGYFKDMMFRDAAIEMPELKILLNRTVKASQDELIAAQLAKEGLTNAKKVIASELVPNAEKVWYKTVYNTVGGALKKAWPTIRSLSTAESAYLYTSRSLNEGVEEVMEEGVSDFFKGLSLGLNAMGIEVKDKYADKIDFNWTPENFLERYATAFVGGAIGGAVFEGLTQWDNKVLHRNINRVSDLEDLDEQMDWYIRNGYGDDLLKLTTQFEKRGKTGSKALSWNYKIQDGKIIYDQAKDGNSQSSAIANIIRDRIKYKQARLETLGLNISDNELILKAMDEIAEDAEKEGYLDLEKYQREKLRDARVDFLKKTGVDKFILRDVAQFQKAITTLEENIENKRAELQNVPDKLKSEQPKDTPEIKRLQKQLDDLKERLDNILQGKAASEYLQLSIYLADEILTNLYTSELTGKDDTWYEKSVANYTRARWGENYDELDEESKQIMQAEYEEWKRAEKREDRIRYAYNMHQLLSNIITPVIQQQVQNYSGYKLEEGRGGTIQGLISEIYRQQLAVLNEEKQEILKKIADIVSNDGDPDEVIDLTAKSEQIENQIKDFSEQLKHVDSPLFALDVTYDTESEKNGFFSIYESAVKNFDIPTVLDLIIDYYQNLNNSKTVSEFSDDILKSTFALIGEHAKRNFEINILNEKRDALNSLASIFDETFQKRLEYHWSRPELATVFHDIVNGEGETETKSEAQILKELWNAHLDQARLVANGEAYDYKFTYNGKNDYLVNHLLNDNILSNIGTIDPDDPDEAIINPFESYANEFQNIYNRNIQLLDDGKYKELTSMANALANAFSMDIDSINSAYQGFEQAVQSLSNLKGVDSNILVASLMFDRDSSILPKLQNLRQLRAQMIHTPILEWIQAMSVELKGHPTNLWNMLLNEIKGLQSKRTLEEYTINDPFALSELNYLNGALISAQAVLRGAMPGGVNESINRLREKDGLDPLIVVENQDLYDVYQNDINILSQRVAYLIDLHEKNHYGTVRQKKLTLVKNAPKIVEALLKGTSISINEEKPQLFIANKLSDIGIDNIADLWNDAGGSSIVLSEVNENNFDQFWQVFRKFQNSIYDKVNQWNPSEGNKLQTVAKTLVSGFTDVWKLKTSTLTALDSSTVENYDVLMWLATTIAIDPRITHGLIKTVKSKLKNITPFFDQSLGIELGFAMLENDTLFNAIVDELANATVEALNKLGIEDEGSKLYLQTRSKIYNAIFIDGSSGTGKSQVELRFIKEMRSLLHPDVKSIAVSEHIERAEALKKALSINDKDVYTKLKLFELILGRPITADDFNEGKTEKDEDTFHIKVLSNKTIQELRSKTQNWKSLYGDTFGLDVYVDESGFLSEGDLQFLSESIGSNNIHFIYAGDEMQNGCVVKVGKRTGNSGTFDVIGIKSVRLNLSMRAGNLGMVKNLQHLETLLKQFLDIYRNEPWLDNSELTTKFRDLYGDITPYKFNFYEDEDNLYGVKFTDDPTTSLEKLKRISKKVENVPSIVIITDDLDKWKNQRSSDIDVLTVEQVQGGEYQFALIDVKNFGKDQDFDYLRNIYTLISRAKKGVYINGEIGSWFPKTSIGDSDVTASIEVNPTANENETDSALSDYSEFWDGLYANEIWSSSSQDESSKSENPPVVTPPPTPAPNPKGPVAVQQEVIPGTPEFKMEDFLKDIVENGLNSQYLKGMYVSKTKRDDYENYIKYVRARDSIKAGGGNGTTLFTEDAINWIMSDDSDDIIINGAHSILRGVQNGARLTEAKKKDYKRLVKGLAMDLIQLSKEELRKKYSENTELRAKWNAIYENNNQWKDLVQKLFANMHEAKTDDGKLNVYSVKDGDFAYLYWTSSDNKYAFPIARIQNLNEIGGLQLTLNQVTPMIILSTNGHQWKPLQEIVGEYADISQDAYVIAVDPNKIATAPETGLRSFISDMIGNPLALISSIFYEGNENALLQRETRDDGTVVRIDLTGKTKGRRRFSAVSKFITFSQWLKLSNTLRGISSRKITSTLDEDVVELSNYLSNKAYDKLIHAMNNPSAAETMLNLSQSCLMSPTNRDLLTTALLRYFFIHKDDTVNYNRFIEHLAKWNKDSYYSNDKKYIRQTGFSFSLFGANSSVETYHILQNGGNYNIVTSAIEDDVLKEVIVGTLTAAEWFDIKGFDPVNSTKAILNKIKAKKQSGLRLQSGNSGLFIGDVLGNFFHDSKVDISDEQIEQLLKDGTITIGLTTRSELIQTDNKVIKNQNVTYFKPFDYNIAELLDGITILDDGDLDQFLKSDTKFKYNFLVGAPAESEQTNSDWMHTVKPTDPKLMLTDIGLILPPIFNFSVGRSNYTGFNGLGSLDHRISTSDPKENQLIIIEQGGKTKYKLQKNFVVPQEALKEYVNNIPNSPEIEIIGATSNSITITDGSSVLELTAKKDPKPLFDGMPIAYGNDGDTIILQNDEASLIKDTSGIYYLRVGNGRFASPKVAYETDDQIAYVIKGKLIVFNKNNTDSISNNTNMLVQNSKYVGQTNDADQLELYYLKDNSLVVYNANANETSVYPNIVLINNVLKSNGDDVMINSSILNKLKYAGVKTQNVRGDKKSEALKEFANAHGLSLNGITTKMGTDQINNWLLANAIALDGIYKWDNKLEEFVIQSTEKDKLLMAFAKWIQSENVRDVNGNLYTAQAIIDYNPTIITNDENSQPRFAEIKLPIENNPANKYRFKMLFNNDKLSIELVVSDVTPESITISEYLQNALGERFSMLSQEDITNITLYAKQLLGEEVDTSTDSFEDWQNNITEIAAEAYQLIDSAINMADQNVACVFKFN